MKYFRHVAKPYRNKILIKVLDEVLYIQTCYNMSNSVIKLIYGFLTVVLFFIWTSSYLFSAGHRLHPSVTSATGSVLLASCGFLRLSPGQTSADLVGAYPRCTSGTRPPLQNFTTSPVVCPANNVPHPLLLSEPTHRHLPSILLIS